MCPSHEFKIYTKILKVDELISLKDEMDDRACSWRLVLNLLLSPSTKKSIQNQHEIIEQVSAAIHNPPLL